MRLILFFLTLSLGLQAETLRVSRAFDRAAVGTEAMRHTRDGYTLIYHVEGAAILTGKDVRSAEVLKEQKGMLAVRLTPEGAKKLSKATKGAAGSLRLAIIVEGVLECVPLVQTQLSDSFVISGLEDREKEALEALVKKLEGPEPAKEGEEKAAE